MYPGLGQTAGTAESAPNEASAAAEYLRARWAGFVDLYPRILDLQHRAAVTAGELKRQGDTEGHEQAKQVVRDLAELAQLHNSIIYRAEAVGEYIGLSGWRGLGAVPIPIVAATSLVALAGLVAWTFRSYYALGEKLRLIEAGVLTPEQAIALDPGPKPVEIVRGVAQIGTLALIGFGLFLAYQLIEAGGLLDRPKARGRAKRNPPLLVYRSNPPERFGRDVHAVYYTHDDDGEHYVHEFEDGVEMYADDDGSVFFDRPDGRPLWADFRGVA